MGVAGELLIDDPDDGIADVLEPGEEGDRGKLGLRDREGGLLVGVDADEPGLQLVGRLGGAVSGSARDAPDDVALVLADHDVGQLLGGAGIIEVADILGVDLDVRVGGLRALDVADEEVVDDRAVLAANKADDLLGVHVRQVGGGGQRGRGADEVPHVVLLVVDADDVGQIDGGVIDQVFLVGVVGRDLGQVVGHLIGAADDQVVGAVGGELLEGGEPFGLVGVGRAELKGLVLDDPVRRELGEAGLAGVEEGFVAEVAVDDVGDLQLFTGGRRGFSGSGAAVRGGLRRGGRCSGLGGTAAACKHH